MTILTEAVRQNSQRQHRVQQKLQQWQRALCGLYVLLFSVVLPFVCWGALADPMHPHRSPHLVFVDPVEVQSNLLASHAVQLANANDAVVAFYNLYLKPHQLSANPNSNLALTNAPTVPAGQAKETLVLFELLTLTLLGTWVLLRFDIPQLAIFAAHFSPDAVSIPIPLPPPRFQFSSC